MTDQFTHADAVISPCGRYRYALTRRWAPGPEALFIMLNPSTADAYQLDPTIRRCLGFAQREGCGAMRIENIYAYRATDPNELFRNRAIAAGETETYICEALRHCDGPLITAWGADVRAAQQAARILDVLYENGAQPLCLGLSKDGAPRHPLYLRRDAALTPLPRRDAT